MDSLNRPYTHYARSDGALDHLHSAQECHAVPCDAASVLPWTELADGVESGHRKEAAMPFDVKELMDRLYPDPKPGEWVPCEYGLPKEFEMVVFVIDDGSTEGRPYMGYRQDDAFRSMYDLQSDPFPIGGSEGVHFWTPIPGHSNLFDGRP